MEFRPINDVVLVERDPRETMSSGGLYLPDSAQEQRSDTGRVLAFGHGAVDQRTGKRTPIDLERGCRVWFSVMSGEDFNLDHRGFIFLRYRDIIAVEDDTDE